MEQQEPKTVFGLVVHTTPSGADAILDFLETIGARKIYTIKVPSGTYLQIVKTDNQPGGRRRNHA